MTAFTPSTGPTVLFSWENYPRQLHKIVKSDHLFSVAHLALSQATENTLDLVI